MEQPFWEKITPFRFVWWITRVILWMGLFAATGYGVFLGIFYGISSYNDRRAAREEALNQKAEQARESVFLNAFKKQYPSGLDLSVCRDSSFQGLADADKYVVLNALPHLWQEDSSDLHVQCASGDVTPVENKPGFYWIGKGKPTPLPAPVKQFGNGEVVPDVTLLFTCEGASEITSLFHGNRVKILPETRSGFGIKVQISDGRVGCLQNEDEVQRDTSKTAPE